MEIGAMVVAIVGTDAPRKEQANRRSSTKGRAPVPQLPRNGANETTQAGLRAPRGKRANSCANASPAAPASQPTKIAAAKPRRTRAINAPGAKFAAPASEPIDEGASSVAEAKIPPPPVVNVGARKRTKPEPDTPRRSTPFGSQDIPAPQFADATEDARADNVADAEHKAPWHPSIPELMQHQQTRNFAITTTGRLVRATESFIASHDAFQELDRKAAFAEAKRVRVAIEKGARPDANTRRIAPPAHSAVIAECAPIVLLSQSSAVGWEAMRDRSEAEMRRLARTLPVWSWASGIRGFGELGVAIIAAEASGPRGDVGSYATKERLWKRLGLAVIEGERQQRKAGDAAIAHGYSPRRRAQIWTICSDSMFRHQWRGAKDDAPAHPIGPYGEVYRARREHTKLRNWSHARQHNDALRIMTKALIEDYWRVWRGLSPLRGGVG